MAPALTVPPRIPADRIVRGYFHAKDENRPHLLVDVFAEDARLEVINAASTIAFPPVAQGRDAIAEVLVRGFNRTYENVYTYCLARPPADAASFACDWLVGMTEKDGCRVRVGCGRYDWRFAATGRGLATGLRITIAAMQVLPPGDFDAVHAWLAALGYPWTAAEEAAARAPGIEAIAPVLQYLVRTGSIA